MNGTRMSVGVGFDKGYYRYERQDERRQKVTEKPVLRCTARTQKETSGRVVFGMRGGIQETKKKWDVRERERER
jgi:hypothetical protein